jgi:hypothetical protein
LRADEPNEMDNTDTEASGGLTTAAEHNTPTWTSPLIRMRVHGCLIAAHALGATPAWGPCAPGARHASPDESAASKGIADSLCAPRFSRAQATADSTQDTKGVHFHYLLVRRFWPIGVFVDGRCRCPASASITNNAGLWLPAAAGPGSERTLAVEYAGIRGRLS